MKYSAASLVFVGLLLASLAGKLLAVAPAAAPDEELFAARAANLLRANGFAVRFERRPLGILTYGDRPGCRMMIGDYTPYGTFADIFAKRAEPIGPLAFAWRGETSREAPKLVPLTFFYLRRELLRLRMAAPRLPIAAVAASPGCDIRSLDWMALATLPA